MKRIDFESTDLSTAGGGLPATATEPASGLLHVVDMRCGQVRFDKTKDISCYSPGDDRIERKHLLSHSHRLARLHMFHVSDTAPIFEVGPSGEADGRLGG